MSDCTTIFNDAINLDKNNETLLSRLLPEHRPLIASYFGHFNDKSWERLQAEITYLTKHHLGMKATIIDNFIQQYSSTPSLESLWMLNELLDCINNSIIISRIDVNSTNLDLIKAGITRFPVSLFKMPNYIEFWKNLTSLFCDDNNIVELNLESLTALKHLWCRNNELITLNMKGLSNIKACRLRLRQQ